MDPQAIATDLVSIVALSLTILVVMLIQTLIIASSNFYLLNHAILG